MSNFPRSSAPQRALQELPLGRRRGRCLAVDCLAPGSPWTPGQHGTRAPAPPVWSEPRTLELVTFLWALLSSGLEQASFWIKYPWSTSVLPWQKLLVLEYYLPIHLIVGLFVANSATGQTTARTETLSSWVVGRYLPGACSSWVVSWIPQELCCGLLVWPRRRRPGCGVTLGWSGQSRFRSGHLAPHLSAITVGHKRSFLLRMRWELTDPHRWSSLVVLKDLCRWSAR